MDPITSAMLQEAARDSGFRGCAVAPAEGPAGLAGPVEVLFLTAADVPTLERAGAVSRLVIVLLEPGSCPPALTDWARQPNRHVLFKPLQQPFLTALFEELATEFHLRVQPTSTGGPAGGPQEPFPGESLVVRRFRHRLLDLARRDVPVLVFGEPGTEKLAAARLLHRHGPRAAAPLIEVGGGGPRPPAPPRRGGDVAWWSQMLSSAQPGSLLLKDVAGLPVASQLDLCRAVALAGRNVRLLATTGGRPLQAVLANGALCSDLYRLPGETGRIEQVVGEHRETAYLLFDERFHPLAIADALLQSADAQVQACQGVAQLVAERGEELIFLAAVLEQSIVTVDKRLLLALSGVVGSLFESVGRFDDELVHGLVEAGQLVELRLAEGVELRAPQRYRGRPHGSELREELCLGERLVEPVQGVDPGGMRQRRYPGIAPAPGNPAAFRGVAIPVQLVGDARQQAGGIVA